MRRRLLYVFAGIVVGALIVGCASQSGGGTDSGGIGAAGGRLTGPQVPGLPGEPRVMVTIPAGQLTATLQFQLGQVSTGLTPPMATGTAVGDAFAVSATGAGAPAALAEVTWMFTFSLAELTAAQVPDARRDALSLYQWNTATLAWNRVTSSLSRTANGRTSIFATFASSTNATIRVGLPPDSLAPTISDLSADELSVVQGGNIDLTCEATDAGGSALTYQWLADSGTIAGSGASATWTTPADHGPATITCVVRTTEGAVAAENIVLVSAWPDPTPASLEGGVCVFCFDDANVGDYYAFDYMYGNYGMKATCFLQSNRLGTVSAATLPQYRAMAAAGWQMGNHTTTGVTLGDQTGTAAAKIAATVTPAQSAIRTALELDEDPTVFASPMGVWGTTAADEAAMATALLGDFDTIRGTYATYHGFPLQHLNSTHYRTGEETHWLDAWSIASGDPITITIARHLIDLASDNNGLAVLHTHNITDSPTRYDMTGEDFRDLIDYIEASGVTVLTFDELYALRGEWPTSTIVADGGFTRMAALWPEMDSVWPNPANTTLDFGTLYYPYQPSDYTAGRVAIDTAVGHNAAGSVRVNAVSGDVVYLHQRLSLEPSTPYRASGWIRTQGLTGGPGAGLTNIGIASEELDAPAGGLTGTHGWTYVEGTFTTPAVGGLLQDVDLWLSVEATSGSAWFDDIEVVPVG